MGTNSRAQEANDAREEQDRIWEVIGHNLYLRRTYAMFDMIANRFGIQSLPL